MKRTRRMCCAGLLRLIWRCPRHPSGWFHHRDIKRARVLASWVALLGEVAWSDVMSLLRVARGRAGVAVRIAHRMGWVARDESVEGAVLVRTRGGVVILSEALS